MRKNKKGFTMVEMLAAIVILGILSSIAIVTVTTIRKNQIKRYNETQLKVFTETGKTYFKDNRQYLPTQPLSNEYVTLKELEEAKYITEDFVDYYGNKYDENSKVKVVRVGNGVYKYNGFLLDSEGAQTQTQKARINSSIHYYKKGGDHTYLTISKNTSKNQYYANKEPMIKFSASSDLNLEACIYYIYKNGKLVNTSEVNYLNSVRSKELKIVLNDVDYGDGSYVVKLVFYDENGYQTAIKSDTVSFDRVAPSTPVLKNLYNNKWTNLSYTISGTSEDSGSGIEKWQYTYTLSNGYSDYSNSSTSSFETPKFSSEMNKTINIRTCDYAGNCSERTTSAIKIDKTPPTQPSLTNPKNNSWANAAYMASNSYTIKGTTTENLSGVARWQYTYNANARDVGSNSSNYWVSYSNSAKDTYTTTPFTSDRNQNVYIRVCDNAGNCSDKSSSMIKIDKTAPTQPSLTNPKDNAWANAAYMSSNSYTIKGTTTEVLSGVDYWQYTYNANATTTGSDNGTNWVTYANSASNSFTTTPFVAERSQNVYIRVCDKAGNCSNKSSSMVKIDKTPPNGCTSSGGTNGGWTASNVTLTGTCTSDNLSGCASSVTKSYTSDTNQANVSPGTIYDNAGNGRSCPANQTVYIDKTPPTCGSFSGGSTTWGNTPRYIYVGCSDGSGSGCTQSNYHIATYSGGQEIQYANLSYTISDKAGKTTTCSYSNYPIYYDAVGPSCVLSFPGVDGYAANTNAYSWNYYYLQCTSPDCTGDAAWYIQYNGQEVSVQDRAGNRCAGSVEFLTTNLHYVKGGATGFNIPIPEYYGIWGSSASRVTNHIYTNQVSYIHYLNIYKKSDTTAYKLNFDVTGATKLRNGRYYGTTENGGYWTNSPNSFGLYVWQYTDMSPATVVSDLYACYINESVTFCANGAINEPAA